MSHRILLVDDDPMVCTVVAQALEESGYEVVAVNSGDEALRHIASSEFDLVLTDLRMPSPGGIEVARRARETSTTQVIVMTGRARDADLQVIVGMGAHILHKPFGIHELDERIQQALANSSKQQR